MTHRRLDELTEAGRFRHKVADVLAIMEGRGFKPAIYSTIRSRSEQAGKVREGSSHTMRSNHLAGPDGKARAADIGDSTLTRPWDAPHDFWITLGRAALRKGLGWGGLFGLSLPVKIKLVRFLLDTSKPFRAANWMGPMGWDPAHVEVRPGWLDSIIVKHVAKAVIKQHAPK